MIPHMYKCRAQMQFRWKLEVTLGFAGVMLLQATFLRNSSVMNTLP